MVEGVFGSIASPKIAGAGPSARPDRADVQVPPPSVLLKSSPNATLARYIVEEFCGSMTCAVSPAAGVPATAFQLTPLSVLKYKPVSVVRAKMRDGVFGSIVRQAKLEPTRAQFQWTPPYAHQKTVPIGR